MEEPIVDLRNRAQRQGRNESTMMGLGRWFSAKCGYAGLAEHLIC